MAEVKARPKAAEERIEAAAATREEHKKALKVLMEFDFAQGDLSEEEVIEKAARLKDMESRAAQVLSRGRTLDAMDRISAKHVPKGHVGLLVRNNELDIARAQALGYELCFNEEHKKSAKDTPTGTADGLIRVGDAVLMSISEEEHRVLQKVKAKRIAEKRRRTDPRALARAARMQDNLPIEEM